MHKRGTKKKKGKQIHVRDSFPSDSRNNQSESWECPARKCLIPDSSVIYGRHASLSSAKKCIITSVQADQVSECSVVELESPPTQVAHASTFAPEIRHEDAEKVGESVAPEKIFSVDVVEVVNHSIQMERNNNAFEAQCIPLEQEPLALAEDIQVQASSNNSMERVDKNNSKSISMVGHISSGFSLNLTEMVNMCNNEGDEVSSVGQSSPIDTVEGYQVKPKFVPILRKILTKHGDVFKSSIVSTMIVRSMLLELICGTISELQDKNLNKITEDELHSMIALANDMKNMKVNIEWLHLRLEEIQEARQIVKQSGMLKEKKDSNQKIIESVKRELEECEAEKKAVAAKLQSIRDKESACMETLARAEDESTKITESITYAKTKVRRFFNCPLGDGLL